MDEEKIRNLIGGTGGNFSEEKLRELVKLPTTDAEDKIKRILG